MDTDNIQLWFEDFKSFEHISGNGCSVDSQYRLKWQMRGMTINVLETVTKNNLPDELCLFEDADKVKNELQILFVEVGEGETQIKITCKYRGAWKFVEMMAPGAFKKKSNSTLESFKYFVEKAS